MGRTRAFAVLGYAVGTLAAFAVGLFGPAIAGIVATYLPGDEAVRSVYALVALLLIGTAAGVFGRGVLGFVALWLGLFLADQAGVHLGAPHPDWLPPILVGLGAASIGYLVARAVDPLWSGAGFGRSRDYIRG